MGWCKKVARVGGVQLKRVIALLCDVLIPVYQKDFVIMPSYAFRHGRFVYTPSPERMSDFTARIGTGSK